MSLKEQLLKAGLVTKKQAQQAAARAALDAIQKKD